MKALIKIVTFIVTIFLISKCMFSTDEHDIQSVSSEKSPPAASAPKAETVVRDSNDDDITGERDDFMAQFNEWQARSPSEKAELCNAAKADCATAGNINQCLEIRHKMEWSAITTVGCGD